MGEGEHTPHFQITLKTFVMKLNIQRLSELVTVYGVRLYEQSIHLGTAVDGEDGVVLVEKDGQFSLQVPTGNGEPMYVQFRRDATPTVGGTFEIHEYVAQRDAEFEYNGKTRTVKKGTIKPFATNA